MNITVRPAALGDVPAILAIYNDAVLNLTASYDYEPSTLARQTGWFAEKRSAGYPVLVAEAGGEVVGWAALGPFRGRVGYRFAAEDSVYVAADRRGQGVGRALLAELIAEARALGLHALVAGIDSEGEASVRLHEALGFEHVGRFRQVGWKFDRWLDVIFMELLLQDGGRPIGE